MDTRQARRAPAAPLTDEEIAAVGEHLRHLRRRRDVGDLSAADYAEQVSAILERRRSDEGHHPERRQGG